MNEVCGDGLWQRWKINPLNTILGEGMKKRSPGTLGSTQYCPLHLCLGRGVYGHDAWGSRGQPTTVVDPPEDSNTHLQPCHH